MSYREFSKDEIRKFIKEKKVVLNEREKDIVELLNNFSLDPKMLDEYFDFTAKFYQYSMRNRLLIYKQNPNAAFCASFQAFKKMGYNVKKGEKGLDILVPVKIKFIEYDLNGKSTRVQYSKASENLQRMADNGTLKTVIVDTYKIGKVFDISQTDCPGEDYPKYIDIGYESIKHKEAGEIIKDFAREVLDVRVIRDDMQSVTLRGEYDMFSNTIRTNDVYEDSTQLSILTHELGHAMLHNTFKSMNIFECEREFQADCVSIMLMKRFGFDIPVSRLDHAYSCVKEIFYLGEKFESMMCSCMQKASDAVSRVCDYIDMRMLERNEPEVMKENEKEKDVSI